MTQVQDRRQVVTYRPKQSQKDRNRKDRHVVYLFLAIAAFLPAWLLIMMVLGWWRPW